MDQSLLVSVIKKQAGSLWKAVVEGGQNVIDAAARKCEIDCTPQMVQIRDNGKGFRSKADIENFFEVFGKPHEEREQKVFGQYRMGRGQLFAFGRNVWRSGEFEMIVDIEENGLDYELRSGLEYHNGCIVTVELYRPLSHVQHNEILDEIKKNIKFVQIPFHLNGDEKQFNKKPDKIAWDLSTAEADFKWRDNGNLELFNQGIRVCSYPRYRYGTGGDIVSKKQLDVNFARNDVMDSCETWQAIRKTVRDHVNARTLAQQETAGRQRNTPTRTRARATNRRRPTLTEQDRCRVVREMKDGSLNKRQMKAAKVFTMWRKETHSTISAVYKIAKGNVTFLPDETPAYSSLPKSLADHRLAVVLDPVMFNRWGWKPEFPEKLVENINATFDEQFGKYANDVRLKYVDADKIVKTMQGSNTVIDANKMTRLERIATATMSANISNIHWAACRVNVQQNRNAQRRIVVGIGPFDSWTDGRTFIAINRRVIAAVKVGPSSWWRYATLLLHEYLHTDATQDAHMHKKDFYEAYHNLVQQHFMGVFCWNCMMRLPANARSVRRRLTSKELATVDAAEEQQIYAQNWDDLGVMSHPDLAPTSREAEE